MNKLTDEIRARIKKGWRAGIEENGGIAVFKVVSRLGNQLRGDEKWRLYPKGSGKEEGPVTINPRLFFSLDTDKIVYCHSRSNGPQHLIESLIHLYE